MSQRDEEAFRRMLSGGSGKEPMGGSIRTKTRKNTDHPTLWNSLNHISFRKRIMLRLYDFYLIEFPFGFIEFHRLLKSENKIG